MGKDVKKVLVKHTLTEEDRARLADSMSDLVQMKRVAEESKKESAKRFTAEISELDNQISDKANIVKQGYVDRKVDCEVIPDYQSQKFFFHRVDNGELVKTQKMTQDEAQKRLPFPGTDSGGIVGGELNLSDDEIADAIIANDEADAK